MCPIDNQTRRKDWEPGWELRLLESVKRSGFSSATEFADSAPTIAHAELLSRLDTRYAPVQLTAVLMQEAADNDDVPRFARRMLAQYLRVAMPDGWGSPNEAFERAHAFGSWSAEFAPVLGRQRIENILEALVRSTPVAGWLALGPDDPLLVSAFS